jgi:hypothetical protein
MKLLFVAIVSFGVLIPAPAAFGQVVHQYTNGNACENYSGAEASSFSSIGPRLRRNTSDGGGTKYVSCPVSFDWDTFSTSFYVNISVTRSSGTITCNLSAYDAAGTYLGVVDSDALSSGTDAFLALGITIPANTRTFAIFCTVPEGAYINMYEYYTDV